MESTNEMLNRSINELRALIERENGIRRQKTEGLIMLDEMIASFVAHDIVAANDTRGAISCYVVFRAQQEFDDLVEKFLNNLNNLNKAKTD